MRLNKVEVKREGLIGQYFKNWTAEQRLSFLEFFIHELTICIRVVWANEELSDEEKVEHIKWINEILHRLPIIAHSIRSGEEPKRGPDAGIGLEHWVAQEEGIRPLVNRAVHHSIRLVTGEYL